MIDDVRYGSGPEGLDGYSAAGLRANFLIEGLFQSEEVRLVYTHLDRMIVGGARPGRTPLTFGLLVRPLVCGFLWDRHRPDEICPLLLWLVGRMVRCGKRLRRRTEG